MRTIHVPAIVATALALSTLSSQAGPCTHDIELLSNRLRVVEQTPFAPESRAATMHRQPTAQSVTAAEANARGLFDTKAASAALKRASEADKANDSAGCARAIDEARQALGVKSDPGTMAGSR
jgi:hypothetical protein